MSTRIIDQINALISMNKTSEEYEAIFGKDVYTSNIPIVQSSDYNSGAIANELEFLRGYIDLVIDSLNIDNSSGVFLEKLVYFFLRLSRIFDEEDSDLKNRFNALIIRNANESWMTKWCVLDVFSYYFSSNVLYIIENYIETDLLLNGDFEDGTGNVFTNWTKSESGTSVIVEAIGGDEFADDRAAEFQVDSSNSLIYLTQTINSIAQGDYKIELFYWDDGNCPVDDVIEIGITRSSDGYYWDFDSSWQSAPIYEGISKITGSRYESWGKYIYQESVSAENITIELRRAGSSGTAYEFRLDNVKFGVWQTYPSIKVLIVLEGTAGGYLSAWPGDIDNLIDRGGCESTYTFLINILAPTFIS